MGRVPAKRCQKVVKMEVVSGCDIFDANTAPAIGTERHATDECFIVSDITNDFFSNCLFFQKFQYTNSWA